MGAKRKRFAICLLFLASATVALSIICIAAEGNTAYFTKPVIDVTLCDVTDDGKNSEADCNEIKNALLYADKDVTADLNGDGTTDIKDYILYKQQLAYDNAENMKEDAGKYGIDYERDDGRILTWHEEFDGETLDYDMWSVIIARSDDYKNDSEHLRIEDGKLTMVTTYSEEQGYREADYICTQKGMNYKYGYAEICARVPYQHGAFPAWWAMSITPYQKAPFFMECDYWEVFGKVNNMGSTLHKWMHPWRTDGTYDSYEDLQAAYPNGEYDYLTTWMHSSQLYTARTGISADYNFENYENLPNEYHIYAWEWTDDYMKGYVDGNCYVTFDITDDADWAYSSVRFDGDFDAYMYGMDAFDDYLFMIFDNEYMYTEGDPAANNGKGTKVVPEDCPFTFQIESVRLWQYPDSEYVHLAEDIAAQEGWQGR